MTGRRLRVAVIGSGFGGLAAAVEARRAGFEVIVFERADTVGGVWRENTYPGAACDVPSPWYSFSFARNTNWPRRYSAQPAILAYLERVSDDLGLRALIRFGTEVVGADFDEQAGAWTVHVRGPGIGTDTVSDDFEVDALVCAVGQLSRPALPAIQGRDEFAGAAFHSAQWRHDVDLAGKRVAVIGTGASAIQFVPEIAPRAGRVTVFQRTPPYLVPRPDIAFRSWRRRRLPQRVERTYFYAAGELLAVALLYSRLLHLLVRAVSWVHMRRQTDRETFARVWPTYPIGCKRILFADDYLPALMRDDVELVTAGIERITAHGIRTTDGVQHPADVMVYGTGFTAEDFLAPLRIRGVGGADLRQRWRGGARAYLGVSVPDFPNLFVIYGPNTNLGSGSIITMLEAQAGYVRQALEYAERCAAPIAVRAEVEAVFDDEMQARLVDGVWAQCDSWYRTASGRVATNWPGTITEYRRRLARFTPGDYAVLRRVRAASSVPNATVEFDASNQHDSPVPRNP